MNLAKTLLVVAALNAAVAQDGAVVEALYRTIAYR